MKFLSTVIHGNSLPFYLLIFILLSVLLFSFLIIRISLLSDSFLNQTFNSQQETRAILKINLIAQYGFANCLYAIKSGDPEKLDEAINLLQASEGYLHSGSYTSIEKQDTIFENIHFISQRMKQINLRYVRPGKPVSVKMIKDLINNAEQTFSILNKADISNWQKLSLQSSTLRKTNSKIYIYLIILSISMFFVAIALVIVFIKKIRTENELKLIKEGLETTIKDRTSNLLEINEKLNKEIKEHKKARQDRILLATAIEQTDEIIVITDMDGVIQYINPAFEKVTGYSREEAIGNRPSILKSGKQNIEFYKKLWNTIKSGKTWKGHFINKKKDDSLYEEEATILPLKNNKDEIINFVAVKRDVTQEIKLETRLRNSQKMEAIGKLAGGIAHDFNNILGIIIGYCQLSIDDVIDKPDTYWNLNEVLKAANRAKDVVKQILTFSRQVETEKIPIKVIPVINEIIKFMRASLPSTIEIKSVINSSRDVIMADPIKIHQVLMNLCVNAGHAMKDTGGTLTITLNDIQLTEGDSIQYPELKSGSYLELSVKDTGSGISKQNIDRIFEPYFTTKNKEEGTGLGLAVVHAIVKDHKGDIGVYSDIGIGTAFHILLPLTEMETEASEKLISDSIPTGNETILFIDDEYSLANLGKKLLESLGYIVVAETNPLAAIKRFKRDTEIFDLIITDKTMPHISGLELAKEVKEINKNIPIILCTGLSESNDKNDVSLDKIDDFLVKPINIQTLAQTVRKIIDQNKTLYN